MFRPLPALPSIEVVRSIRNDDLPFVLLLASALGIAVCNGFGAGGGGGGAAGGGGALGAEPIHIVNSPKCFLAVG